MNQLKQLYGNASGCGKEKLSFVKDLLPGPTDVIGFFAPGPGLQKHCDIVSEPEPWPRALGSNGSASERAAVRQRAWRARPTAQGALGLLGAPDWMERDD